MGLTAMLELYPSSTFDPGDPTTKVLFEVKGALPFGWFLFFAPADFKKLGSRHDESDYTVLARDHAAAIELARARAARIAKLCSEPLRTSLEGLVESVAASGKGTLVLNSHRLESSRAELTAPIKWIESVAKKGLSERLIDSGDELFESCEGISFEPDDEDEDDESTQLSLGELHGVTGWPIEAAKAEWYEALTNPAPEVAPDRPAEESTPELLAAVWANPHDEAARRVCADALIERGDPRGEFIALECLPERSPKQSRRLEKLLDLHRASFSLPFRGEVAFRRGFADEVQWYPTPDDPLVGHPAWSTVRTLEFGGPASMLTHPSLAHLLRLRVAADLVPQLAALGVPLPFRSIRISSAVSDTVFRTLASVACFPELVEVSGSGSGFGGHVLSEAGQQLIAARPQLHVRLSPLPIEQLLPVTAEEHAKRLRWWADPPGPYLAGPRYDDGWR